MNNVRPDTWEATASLVDEQQPIVWRDPEIRRSSSIYSTDTGITDIIELYSQESQYGETSACKFCHAAIHKLPRTSIQGTAEENHLDTEPVQRPVSPMSATDRTGSRAGSRQAPSFVEFSRQLRHRRAQLVPISSLSTVNLRTPFLDTNTSTPTVSSIPCCQKSNLDKDLSQSLRRPSFIPIRESSLVPVPLYFDRSRHTTQLQSECPSEIFEVRQRLRRCEPQSPSSSNSRVVYNSLGEIVKAKITGKMRKRRKKIGPDMEEWKIRNWTEPKSTSSFHRDTDSEMGPTVSSFMQSLSLSDSGEKQGMKPAKPRREKQLAIPPTPYQMYGAEVWLTKSKKKSREQQQQHRHTCQSNMFQELWWNLGKTQEQTCQSNRHLSRSNGFVTASQALEGAKRKLTRTSSQKRRERMKKSITLIGPTTITSSSIGVGAKEPDYWI